MPGDPLVAAHPVRRMLCEEMTRRFGTGPNVCPDPVRDAGRHALLPPGKLLRPLLLMESGVTAGACYDALVPAALALEYLHAGSLVHDDVIDHDATRRGRPSVVAAFGPAGAIVTGDDLILAAFETMVECADRGVAPRTVLEVQRLFARLGREMCVGQAIEEGLVGRLDCGLDAYLGMVSRKTGALFRAACVGGGRLAEASPEHLGVLADYAHHLGLAFQMWDDLLPYLSTDDLAGKSCTSDLVAARPTFPLVVAHELADPAGRRQLEAALAPGTDPRVMLSRVRAVLVDVDALAEAQDRAGRERDAAVKAVDALPASASADVLRAVARSAVGRAA